MKYPILKGFVKNRQLWVWCPFCQTWHIHGAEDGDGSGHRIAHCHSGLSPFERGGYYAKPYTKTDLKRFGVVINDS